MGTKDLAVPCIFHVPPSKLFLKLCNSSFHSTDTQGPHFRTNLRPCVNPTRSRGRHWRKLKRLHFFQKCPKPWPNRFERLIRHCLIAVGWEWDDHSQMNWTACSTRFWHNLLTPHFVVDMRSEDSASESEQLYSYTLHLKVSCIPWFLDSMSI